MCEYLHLSPKVHAPLLNALQRSAPDSRACFFSLASALRDFPVRFLSTPPSPRLPASALSSSTTFALVSARGGTGRRNSVFTAAEPFAMRSSAVGGTHGLPSGPVNSDIPEVSCHSDSIAGWRVGGSRLRREYGGGVKSKPGKTCTTLVDPLTWFQSFASRKSEPRARR